MESCLVASRLSVPGSQRNFTPWLTAPHCFVRRSGYCHTSAPQPPGLRQGRSSSTTTRRAIVRDWNWYWKVWRVPSSMAKRWDVITCPSDTVKGETSLRVHQTRWKVRRHYVSIRHGERWDVITCRSDMARNRWDIIILCTMNHGEQVRGHYMYYQTWRKSETLLNVP